jgi:hypothetical protein
VSDVPSFPGEKGWLSFSGISNAPDMAGLDQAGASCRESSAIPIEFLGQAVGAHEVRSGAVVGAQEGQEIERICIAQELDHLFLGRPEIMLAAAKPGAFHFI